MGIETGPIADIEGVKEKVKKLNGREVSCGGLPIDSLKQAGIDIGIEGTNSANAPF